MTTLLGAMMLAGSLIARARHRYLRRPAIIESWLARDLRAGHSPPGTAGAAWNSSHT